VELANQDIGNMMAGHFDGRSAVRHAIAAAIHGVVLAFLSVEGQTGIALEAARATLLVDAMKAGADALPAGGGDDLPLQIDDGGGHTTASQKSANNCCSSFSRTNWMNPDLTVA